MKHLDLFSGIGGFALAAESIWPEIDHTFVEKDLFCQAVLKKHWPEAKIHDDIKTFKGQPADIITGGFPCQPFSSAGKRRGTKDDRHLWPEMLRVIRASSPKWVIGENVGGLLTWDGGMVLDKVLADLEAEGYEAWPLVIPACAVNAPHKRDRVWIIAYAYSYSNGGKAGEDARSARARILPERNEMGITSKPDTLRIPPDTYVANDFGRRSRSIPDRERVEAHKQAGKRSWSKSARCGQDAWREEWPAALGRLCTLDDGLPGGLVRPRGWRNAALKAAGNAIVPQVAAEIFKVIKEIESQQNPIHNP